ncbi:MAG: tetratricopeptide repeat protein [Sedimentisphaerales bacterium]|nr:tetratricopeptide repeat protein [Sedimentisphaerales bacterium]
MREELQIAKALLAEFPDEADPWVISGNVLSSHGDLPQAETYWQEALKRNPRRDDVYSSLGWAAMQQERHEQAVAYWRRTLEIRHDCPGVHKNIARAWIVLGRSADAIEELQQELRLFPQDSLSHFFLGELYQQQKDYEQAKIQFQAAVRCDPAFTNGYYGLATVCTRLGQMEQAAGHWQTFRTLKAEERKNLKARKTANPNDLADIPLRVARTCGHIGLFYQNQGHPAQAERFYLRALELDPRHAESLKGLAQIYQAAGRFSEALARYTAASRLEPDDAVCHLNAGLIYIQLQRGPDAEAALRRAIEADPAGSAGYRELARMFLRQGTRLDEARQLAQQAVAAEPLAVNYYVLGWACDKNGDLANALSAMRRALELEPANEQYQKLYLHLQQRP